MWVQVTKGTLVGGVAGVLFPREYWEYLVVLWVIESSIEKLAEQFDHIREHELSEHLTACMSTEP